MEEFQEVIVEVFSEVQDTTANHQKNVQLLKKQFNKVGIEPFFETFKMAMQKLMLTPYAADNKYADNLVEFIADFTVAIEKATAGEDENSVFLTKLFHFFNTFQDHVLDAVRYRSCQLIYRVLKKLTGYDLTDDICATLEEASLDRINDPKYYVRMMAASAMAALQDPHNVHCPIIIQYLEHLTDPNAMVRKVCIEKVAPRKDVIKAISKHCLDIDTKVRLATYMRLTSCLKYLQIADKQQLLKYAAQENRPVVLTYIKGELLPQWLEFCKGDFLQLIKSFRIDTDWDEVKETLRLSKFVFKQLFSVTAMLEVLKFDENRLLPFENLTFESAIFWRLLIEDFKDAYDGVDMPQAFHFCDYIEEYCKRQREAKGNDFQYILYELVSTLSNLEICGPVLEEKYNTLLGNILRNETLDLEVVMHIVSKLVITLNTQAKLEQFIAAIVSDLMYVPVEAPVQQDKPDDFEMARLQVRVHELREELESAIMAENFVEASNIKNRIEEIEKQMNPTSDVEMYESVTDKTKDFEEIKKYLDISIALLSLPKICKLTDILKNLKKEAFEENLRSGDNKVIAKAYKAYSLCCLLDRETALVGIHLFIMQFEAHKEGGDCEIDLLEIAIATISDLLLLFGTNLVSEPDEVKSLDDNTTSADSRCSFSRFSLMDILKTLCELMQDEEPKIQECAGLGLCNLVRKRRIQSTYVISRLIIKFCTPSEDIRVIRLKQNIMRTLYHLPKFATTASSVQDSVLPTIKIIIKAPAVSLLSDLDPDQVSNFLLHICSLYEDGKTLHYNIAKSILDILVNKPVNMVSAYYSKMLMMLKLDYNNTEQVQALLDCLCEAEGVVTEKKIVVYLRKFRDLLEYPPTNEVSQSGQVSQAAQDN